MNDDVLDPDYIEATDKEIANAAKVDPMDQGKEGLSE